jgi:hypothetical protein
VYFAPLEKINNRHKNIEYVTLTFLIFNLLQKKKAFYEKLDQSKFFFALHVFIIGNVLSGGQIIMEHPFRATLTDLNDGDTSTDQHFLGDRFEMILDSGSSHSINYIKIILKGMYILSVSPSE